MPVDSGDEFARDAAAAASEASGTDNEGGAPPGGGTDPAEADPTAKLAASLRAAGVTPETARGVMETLASLQTPKGQQEYMERFLSTDQGRQLKARFGQEHLAETLAQPQGPQRLFGLLKEWGVNPDPAPEESEDMSPEAREVKAMRRQQEALESRIKATEARSQQLEGRLKGRDESDERQQVFVQWAGSRPPMAQPAYAAVARRAHELVALNPGMYGGTHGFRAAADEALTQLTSIAPLFSAKPRPRSLRTDGGGVPGKSKTFADLPLDAQVKDLDKWIEQASEEIAYNSRHGEE